MLLVALKCKKVRPFIFTLQYFYCAKGGVNVFLDVWSAPIVQTVDVE